MHLTNLVVSTPFKHNMTYAVYSAITMHSLERYPASSCLTLFVIVVFLDTFFGPVVNIDLRWWWQESSILAHPQRRSVFFAAEANNG